MTTDDGADIRDKWAVLNEKNKGRRVEIACAVISIVAAVLIIGTLIGKL